MVSLAMAHVALTVFFIMVTGNHFWLDAVAGAACVVMGRLLAWRVIRPFQAQVTEWINDNIGK